MNLEKKQADFVKKWVKQHPNETLEDIPSHLMSDEDLGVDEILGGYNPKKRNNKINKTVGHKEQKKKS